jgi:hypothetical protein
MGSRKNLGLAALLHHGLDARVGVNGHTPRLGEPFPTGAKHDPGKCRAPDSPAGRHGLTISGVEPISEFAADSPLEGAVYCELVSEVKFRCRFR